MLFDSRPQWSVMAKPPLWQRRAVHCHEWTCPKRGPDLVHLTLLSLGPWDDLGCGMDRLMDALWAVEAEPFLLVLDHAEAKQGSDHVELVSGKSAAAAQRLRATLWAALVRHGIPFRSRSRIRPHVTLNYQWQGGAFREPIAPVPWLIDELLLIESLTGKTEHVLHGRFPVVPRQGMLFPLMQCSATQPSRGGGTLAASPR